MKWRCMNCGHEQPAHPQTKREDMNKCSQFNFQTGQKCSGDKPYKFDSAGKQIEPGT